MAEEAHAVVYPASEVGSVWPVPTWNLRTQCQSLQAAGVKLPAGLSASLREGATRIAMMGVNLKASARTRNTSGVFSLQTYWAMAKSERLSLCDKRLGVP